MVSGNRTFWTKAATLMQGQNIALTLLFVGLTAAFIALFVSFSVKYVTKPLLILLIMISAFASWFMDQYGVIIDVEMLQSAIDTTNAEAGHFLTPAFLLHLLLLGVLPSLAIAYVRVEHRPYLQKVKWNLAVILPALVVFLACTAAYSGTFFSLGREHHELFDTLNPISPVAKAVKLVLRANSDQHIVVHPLGLDAHVVGTSAKPRVAVIIAGETARAESFSLGGYQKETNPELAKENITYFPHTSSCGTITEVSIPCMFSVYRRKEYSHRKGLETENLLDVLGHAGIKTEWWDNNTGDKGVAKRTAYTPLFKSGNATFCNNQECLDDILLAQLDNWLDDVKSDSVLVLHQLGSHGPAYHLRYTEAFRKFTPDCQTAEFGRCSRDEIINAYDNTILYTDHFIATVIERLKQRQSQLAVSMLYVSDHGESTGEYGLYLHGTPYMVAPSQQTHVPFLAWLGDDEEKQVDSACLGRVAGNEYSHDNLFHTVLGMMRVETNVYQTALDVFAPCRGKNTSQS
jgi:lipid A ethanolaminephosphotransferase